MIGRLAAAGSILMTIGCAPIAAAPAEPESYPVRGGSGRTCDASKARSLVGRPSSAALGAEAMRLSGADALRWLRPGQMVTMEYREGRLNIDLDADDRVKAVRCG